MSSPFDDAIAGFRLGESETFLRLDGPEQFARAELALIRQTRRQLYIQTPDFEPDRFNSLLFADVLSAFVRRSRFVDARILVGDPAIAVRWGHKVVNLARRLPTRLLIRQLLPEDFDTPQERNEAWMVADDIGLLRRDGTEGMKGMLAARAIPHAQRAREKFQERWERAREVRDFRQLSI